MPDLNVQIVRLYDTVFDRAPDAEGLAFWNNSALQGVGLGVMADLFITAPEFAATYGQPDNLSFVQAMYRNVLDRPGEAEGVAFWTRALDEGLADRGDIVVGFSESPEHVAQMAAASAPAPVLAAVAASEPASAPTGVHGGPGADALAGGDGRDSIHAYDGDDTLQGQGGDDLLFGGPGADRMGGGPGSDVFRFDGLLDMDRDYIHGFEVGADVLDFSPLHLVFRGQGAFEATGEAQLRYVDDYTPRAAAQSRIPGSTHVYLDADGDGAPDARMSIEHRALTDASFLV